MPKRYVLIALIAVLMSLNYGCGYTTRSALSPDIKSIYVNSFENKIAMADEQTDTRMYKGYRPGLEAEITKAIIDRFLFD